MHFVLKLLRVDLVFVIRPCVVLEEARFPFSNRQKKLFFADSDFFY